MIKVIVSHDVDHLFDSDHWFRDLIYPKMWVRSTWQLLNQEITANEWVLRIKSCFLKKRHNLENLMIFDKAYGIKSTFFFGMNQGLGMSYKPEEAKEVIHMVQKKGFDIGVHGIDYQNIEVMKKEFDTFEKTMGFKPCGIRMHYVRFDDQTFSKLNEVGYLFDTTEFYKDKSNSKNNPYRVGNMWEFPLVIMDAYLPQKLENAKQKTLEILSQCNLEELKYITVLFHDIHFCEAYKDMYAWYKWLIEYFTKSSDYIFVSFNDAIRELEAKND